MVEFGGTPSGVLGSDGVDDDDDEEDDEESVVDGELDRRC